MLLCLLPSVAAAETSLSAAAAVDVHLSPAASGNGILVAQADIGALRLIYNSDTVDVSWMWSDRETGIRIGARGQAFAGGVSTAYWERGEERAERGYTTSSAGPYLEIERTLGEHLFAGTRSTVRRWWFGGGTEAFAHPDDFTSFEQQVSLTYWDFAPDPSLWQPHYFFRRLRGFGFGVRAEAMYRSRATDWGSDDGRNLANPRSLLGAQWLGFGFGDDAIRLQVEQQAFAGSGLDDVTRARVGGLNPYTYRLSGVGWPAFVTSQVIAGQGSVLFAAGEHEFGIGVDAVVVRDPLRDGSSDYAALGGAQLIADLRLSEWQVDARFGWALPSDVFRRTPQLQLFVGAGRAF